MVLPGLTLDTGALIALERRKQRVRTLVYAATEARLSITVPVVVISEWWNGRPGQAFGLVDSFRVEPLTADLARRAGEARARLGGAAAVVDSIVMASAAQRGDRVLTSDMEDLARLQAVFPEVRLQRV